MPWISLVTAIAAGDDHTAAGYRRVSGPASLTTAYTYDRLYRLTGADDGTARGYGYDPAGNRSSKDTTGYGYDRADRVTSAGGVSYMVDANGNLALRGADSFGYDQADRMRTASGGETRSSYVCDPAASRASRRRTWSPGRATTARTHSETRSVKCLPGCRSLEGSTP